MLHRQSSLVTRPQKEIPEEFQASLCLARCSRLPEGGAEPKTEAFVNKYWPPVSVCRKKNDQIPLAAKIQCYWSQDLGHFRNKDASSEAMARGFLGDPGCSRNLSEWLNGLNYGFRVVAATTQFIKSYVNWGSKTTSAAVASSWGQQPASILAKNQQGC